MDKDPGLIAPCGMNCAICSAYLARAHDLRRLGITRTYCTGCRLRDKKCAILKKRCRLLREGKVLFCSDCPDYPCSPLKRLDKRYRERYRMSMLENLAAIRGDGIERFLQREQERWKCPDCGGTICCHNGICFGCGLEKLRAKRHRYRWEDE